MTRTCALCRYLSECARDTGAHPTDPICTAFIPASASRQKEDT